MTPKERDRLISEWCKRIARVNYELDRVRPDERLEVERELLAAAESLAKLIKGE